MTAHDEGRAGVAVEFSRVQVADRIPAGGLRRRIEADPEECTALSRRLDLIALEELKAELVLTRVGDGTSIKVDGRLIAQVVQRCVVTLGPVPATVETDFSETYAPDAVAYEETPDLDLTLELLPGMDLEESPEPLGDGRIDLGELAVQYLSLALEPYPRCEGATVPAGYEAEIVQDATVEQNPFAALAAWRGSE